jgi:hypothetical protein
MRFLSRNYADRRPSVFLDGLFGINMPLLYGEGEVAFQRLQKEIMGLTNQSSGLRLLGVSSIPLTIKTISPKDAPPYAVIPHLEH